MQGFPGGSAMAMPQGMGGGQVVATQHANPGASAGEASEQTYEIKLDVAHKHAVESASRDAKRACQPGVNVPFHDLDDAITRLLPYHVFSAPDDEELDYSVVGAQPGGDGEKTETDGTKTNDEREASTSAPVRSRAQAWAESKQVFVKAFVEELASKRKRVEVLVHGGEGTQDGSDEKNDKNKNSSTKPKPPTLAPAETYLVAAKTLGVAKRRDASEKAARAREQAEKTRIAEVERQRLAQKARTEAEQRRAQQIEAANRARAEAVARAQGGVGGGAGAVSGTTQPNPLPVLPSTVVAPGVPQTVKPPSQVLGPAITFALKGDAQKGQEGAPPTQ